MLRGLSCALQAIFTEGGRTVKQRRDSTEMGVFLRVGPNRPNY